MLQVSRKLFFYVARQCPKGIKTGFLQTQNTRVVTDQLSGVLGHQLESKDYKPFLRFFCLGLV